MTSGTSPIKRDRPDYVSGAWPNEPEPLKKRPATGLLRSLTEGDRTALGLAAETKPALYYNLGPWLSADARGHSNLKDNGDVPGEGWWFSVARNLPPIQFGTKASEV